MASRSSLGGPCAHGGGARASDRDVTLSLPFALSVSKGRFSFGAAQQIGRCFDKPSTNGSWVGPEALPITDRRHAPSSGGEPGLYAGLGIEPRGRQRRGRPAELELRTAGAPYPLRAPARPCSVTGRTMHGRARRPLASPRGLIAPLSGGPLASRPHARRRGGIDGRGWTASSGLPASAAHGAAGEAGPEGPPPAPMRRPRRKGMPAGRACLPGSITLQLESGAADNRYGS